MQKCKCADLSSIFQQWKHSLRQVGEERNTEPICHLSALNVGQGDYLLSLLPAVIKMKEYSFSRIFMEKA